MKIHGLVKTTLRAQWNPRQGRWRIVKKTENGAGGWRLFGGIGVYLVKGDCESAIKRIVNSNPDQYQEG